jgi:hypothetical protein
VGITFDDPNCWIEDGDFGRDGVHHNGRGKTHLGNLYARVSGLGVEPSAESKWRQTRKGAHCGNRDYLIGDGKWRSAKNRQKSRGMKCKIKQKMNT